MTETDDSINWPAEMRRSAKACREAGYAEEADGNEKLAAHIEKLERERDEARIAFNDIDLCQHGQAPCKYALTIMKERDELRKAIEDAPCLCASWGTCNEFFTAGGQRPSNCWKSKVMK